MNEERIDANIDEERVPNEVIIEFFPELLSNPFGRQLCRVFSSASDQATMNFEDFLDMCSVLSPHAPIQTKADWAFRVFGKKNVNVPSRFHDAAVKVFSKRLLKFSQITMTTVSSLHPT